MDKYKIISGSVLKTIALIAMLIDHIAAFFLQDSSNIILRIGTKQLTNYSLMRIIGRIAFPIYCFLLVEGFVHTKNRKDYGLRLFLFALISEIPWNLAHSGSVLYPKQNVFFTLLFGYLGMCSINKLEETEYRDTVSVVELLALLLCSIVCNADYGCKGFAFILMLYVLRKKALVKSVIGACILPSKWAGLAFFPIALYNDKRGYIKDGKLSLLFYSVYPLHFLVIWLIKGNLA
ncbi:MAG: TraX protein [Erysipelotrichaceae bacterium]|nr:TraX protein [Erysipelotrichaceae bacterium]